MSIVPLIIFVLYYSAGTYYIYNRERKNKSNNTLFMQGSWLLFSITLYTSVLELLKGTAYFLVPLLFFLFFIRFYFKKRTRLLNGFLFQMFLVIYGTYLIYNFYLTHDLLIAGLFFIALVVFLLIALFGALSLVIFLYWNSFVILKKESFSIANMLTLFLAVLLTIYIGLSFIIRRVTIHWSIHSIYLLLSFILFYFFSLLIIFLTATLLYQFYRPTFNQDFVIILGAGLINGERVTPLLAKRIDRAISFARLQKVKSGHPIKFVMSGGQGTDEKIPEAVAMKNYALEKGVNENQILLESNSTTTYENMKFSKEVIDKQPIDSAKVIFSSNNYHLFRAGIFADEAGVKADGIGSHTAFYYIPNAFLREFVAILMLHRKRHIFVLIGAILFTMIGTVIDLFLQS